MTIEIAPKAPTVSSKEAGGAAVKKPPESQVANAVGPLSFLAAFTEATTAQPLVEDGIGITPEPWGGEGAAPVVGELSPLTSAADASEDSSVAAWDAAIWMGLGMAPPVPVPATSPAVEVAAPAAGRAGPKDSSSALSLPPDGMKRPVTGGAGTKSGKDALLAVAQASVSDVAAEGVVAQGSGAVSAQPPVKDLPVERIQKWVQEASAAVPRVTESGAWVASGLRDKGLEAVQSARSSGAESLVQIQGAQQGSGGAMGVDGVVAGGAAEAAGSGFAEEVKYWVGQDLQKAELSLDGIGTSPVEISISLQGNEAHVAFRSDEVQTREALSNAGAQLQEALNRQGMSLAGVTVGGSQTGDSRGRSGQEKDTPWRRARVEGAVEGVAATPAKPLPAGRSIDLFV